MDEYRACPVFRKEQNDCFPFPYRHCTAGDCAAGGSVRTQADRQQEGLNFNLASRSAVMDKLVRKIEIPLAKKAIDPEKGVETLEDALAGASDIIAEIISDDPDIRKALREKMESRAVLTVQAVNPEAESVYSLYYNFSAPVSRLLNHQIL